MSALNLFCKSGKISTIQINKWMFSNIFASAVLEDWSTYHLENQLMERGNVFFAANVLI